MGRRSRRKQAREVVEMQDQNAHMLKFCLIGIIGLYWFCYEFICKEKHKLMHELKANLVCPPAFNKSNEGKPVCISGPLDSKSKTPLKDDEFQLTVLGLSLKRHVEMFQYNKETNSKYYINWSSKPIDSSNFLQQYANPKWHIHDYFTTVKGDLNIGQYLLDSSLLKYIQSWKGIIGSYTRYGYRQDIKHDKIILYNSYVFKTLNVGSYRIKHEYIPCGLPVTVIGKQQGNRIVDYKGVFIVREGYCNADDMIDNYSLSSMWTTRILSCLSICFLLI